jgi:hypothetical protein
LLPISLGYLDLRAHFFAIAALKPWRHALSSPDDIGIAKAIKTGLELWRLTDRFTDGLSVRYL